MRVLHFNAWERSGGAARAANRLHRGLLANAEILGVGSRMLTQVRESDDPTVAAFEAPSGGLGEDALWGAINWYWIAENRTDRTNTWFSSGRPGHDVSRHPWVDEADVLHLHWIPGFLASRDVAKLLAVGKPVVWTLHDEWAFTGGCHYAAGCEQWRTACRDCPQLRRDPHGLVAAIFNDKQSEFSNSLLTVAAPSRWLTERARSSAILGRREAVTIPYGLELDVFCPAQRAAGRQALGVDDETMLILFAASDGRERRKGFAELTAALSLCAKDPRAGPRIEAKQVRAVTLGLPGQQPLPIDTIERGVLHDDASLAAMVAACDLYVIPSLEDNLPNGVLEAMACGTPVAGFASGGIPEALEGAPLDLLAQTGDVGGLGRRLAEAIDSLAALRSARHAMRTLAESRFALARQAHDYAELYRRLLPSARGAQKTQRGST